MYKGNIGIKFSLCTQRQKFLFYAILCVTTADRQRIVAPSTGVLSIPLCTMKPSLAGLKWCLDVGTAWPTHIAPRSVFIRHWTGLVGALPRSTAVLRAHSAPGSRREDHLRRLKYAASTIRWVGRVVASRNADTPTSVLSADAHTRRPSVERGTDSSFPPCLRLLPSPLPGGPREFLTRRPSLLLFWRGCHG